MRVWCGIDQGETWNEIAVVDDAGRVLGRLRARRDPQGVRQTIALVRQYAKRAGPAVVVAEGSGDSFLRTLADRGLDVRVIHVITSSRWRGQYDVSGSKSDPADAVLLAEYGRLQSHKAARLPRNSDLALAIRVLTRNQDELVRLRQRLDRQLRSCLLGYFPAAVDVFPTLHRPIALTTIRLVRTPERAKALHTYTLLRDLRAAGIKISLQSASARLAGLRVEQLHEPSLTSQASGTVACHLVDLLESVNSSLRRLEQEINDAFGRHPQAEIYRSFPALGGILAARLLGEIGDDIHRFGSGRDLCAYAGTAPVTKASGLHEVTHRRRVCNHRLNRYAFNWTMPLVRLSPAAHALYYARRAQGDRHPTAARNVVSKYLRGLHHCLISGEPYSEGVLGAELNRRRGDATATS
jgi:transposase